MAWWHDGKELCCFVVWILVEYVLFDILIIVYCVSIISCCSVTKLYPALCNPLDCSTPGFLSFTMSWNLQKLMSIESRMPSNHLILCCPFSSCPQSFPAAGSFPMSQHFTSDQSFSFIISPSSEYSGLISFRIDWFDLAVQGTLKSLLQHHSLKASVFQHKGAQASLWSTLTSIPFAGHFTHISSKPHNSFQSNKSNNPHPATLYVRKRRFRGVSNNLFCYS